MTSSITKEKIVADLQQLGISKGDIVMVRAALSSIGRIKRQDILEALLEAIGPDGTLISLAFTSGVRPWLVRTTPPFTTNTVSYAGALPNMMLEHACAKRSTHPQTSFVAIGRDADSLLDGHDPRAPAYDPVRKLIELKGKMLLIGCAATSPGFTTTHVAERDIGMGWRILPSWLFCQSRYIDTDGQVKIFKRHDGGFCSNSYWKFYSAYVKHALLRSGYVGQAYSLLAPAAECYMVERGLLEKHPHINVCDDPLCFTCNVQRIDRWHCLPSYLLRRLLSKCRKTV